MPLRKYYSEQHLRNQGESVVARMLNDALSYSPEQWYMIHAYMRAGHKRDTAGECDFILIGPKGLIVLEVKGSKWKRENNIFYQTQNNKFEARESPFQQARNNKGAIIQILQDKGIGYAAVSAAVIFSESDFPLEDPPDPFWHLGRLKRDVPQELSTFLEQLMEEQFQVLQEKFNKPVREVTKQEMLDIVEKLSPSVLPNEVLAHLQLSREEAKRRAGFNLRMLDGLRANERLMIQGPPGSGKSAYAKALAMRRFAMGDAKILYLCWNELLAVYNGYKFKEANNTAVKAWAYFHFVRQLKVEAGLDPAELSYEEVNRPGGMEQHLSTALDILEVQGRLPEYDFIIVDECQDLFHKGIEKAINRLTGGRQGLRMGCYAVFFDNTQVFSQDLDRAAYERAWSALKEHAALYQIDYRYRGTAGVGLYEFIADLESGDIDLGRTYGHDVIVRTYTSTEEMWKLLRRSIDEVRSQAGHEERRLVTLFTSNLSSGIQRKKNKLLDDELDAREEFIRINHENLTMAFPDAVKYTTALTYKGLERDIVILVVKDFYDRKIDCIHQVLIGASRARIRLYLIIDKESILLNGDYLARGAVSV